MRTGERDGECLFALIAREKQTDAGTSHTRDFGPSVCIVLSGAHVFAASMQSCVKGHISTNAARCRSPRSTGANERKALVELFLFSSFSLFFRLSVQLIYSGGCCAALDLHCSTVRRFAQTQRHGRHCDRLLIDLSRFFSAAIDFHFSHRTLSVFAFAQANNIKKWPLGNCK